MDIQIDGTKIKIPKNILILIIKNCIMEARKICKKFYEISNYIICRSNLEEDYHFIAKNSEYKYKNAIYNYLLIVKDTPFYPIEPTVRRFLIYLYKPEYYTQHMLDIMNIALYEKNINMIEKLVDLGYYKPISLYNKYILQVYGVNKIRKKDFEIIEGDHISILLWLHINNSERVIEYIKKNLTKASEIIKTLFIINSKYRWDMDLYTNVTDMEFYKHAYKGICAGSNIEDLKFIYKKFKYMKTKIFENRNYNIIKEIKNICGEKEYNLLLKKAYEEHFTEGLSYTAYLYLKKHGEISIYYIKHYEYLNNNPYIAYIYAREIPF